MRTHPLLFAALFATIPAVAPHPAHADRACDSGVRTTHASRVHATPRPHVTTTVTTTRSCCSEQPRVAHAVAPRPAVHHAPVRHVAVHPVVAPRVVHHPVATRPVTPRAHHVAATATHPRRPAAHRGGGPGVTHRTTTHATSCCTTTTTVTRRTW